MTLWEDVQGVFRRPALHPYPWRAVALLAAVVIIPVLAVVYAQPLARAVSNLLNPAPEAPLVVPTVIVVPSQTSTPTPSMTVTATETPSPTATQTASPTPTEVPTLAPMSWYTARRYAWQRCNLYQDDQLQVGWTPAGSAEGEIILEQFPDVTIVWVFSSDDVGEPRPLKMCVFAPYTQEGQFYLVFVNLDNQVEMIPIGPE